MRATSTSDSQVHGHLFVLRRMENALVHRDTRMLRDPASRHRRALQAGVGLAMLGLLAALVIGVIHPVPALPDEGIVIAKRSGAVYVVTKDPATLTPTFNLASAKLLVAGPGGPLGW